MSKCPLSLKTIRKKIQPLMPLGWTVNYALVRGGWTHGLAEVFAVGPEGERLVGKVNYITGKRFEVKDGVTWCSDEGGQAIQPASIKEDN